jgi:hypothetical protein
MKKLLVILSVVMMFGCCGSKIAPQYITSGVILLPDYTHLVKNSRYCCVDTVIQVPLPGFIHTQAPSYPVTIIGYDCYGKTREFDFCVVTVKTLE